MDARDLSRIDRGLLYAAVGDRKHFVSLVVKAIVEEHGLDLQIHREGRGFLIVMIETAGDAVVAEHRLPVAWDSIDEDARLYALKMYVEGLVEGHERWRRRVARSIATVINPVAPVVIAANDVQRVEESVERSTK